MCSSDCKLFYVIAVWNFFSFFKCSLASLESPTMNIHIYNSTRLMLPVKGLKDVILPRNRKYDYV
jgi:hypothetical protein